MGRPSLLILFLMLVGLGVAATYVSRNAPRDVKKMPMKYVGTWRCPPEPDGMLDGELGPTRITLTLGADAGFKAVTEVTDSPAGDWVGAQEGRFVVDGERFVSSDFDAGNPCKIVFEGDLLVVALSGDEVYRFARVK